MTHGEVEVEIKNEPIFGRAHSDYDPDPEVGIEVICDGDNEVWRARVATATVGYYMELHPSNKILDASVIEGADCSTLLQMQEEVSAIIASAGRPGYPEDYDLWQTAGFLAAHEAVHLRHMRESVDRHYPTFVAEIESITRNCDDFTQSEAMAEMQPEIDEAVDRFVTRWRSDQLLSAEHLPPGDFTSVHEAELGSLLNEISNEIEIKGCLD